MLQRLKTQWQAQNTPLASTLSYACHYISFGLSVAIIGPSLPTFMKLTHKTESQIGTLLTSRGLGGLFGALISPWLVVQKSAFFTHHLVMFLELFVLALCMCTLSIAVFDLNYLPVYWLCFGLSGFVMTANSAAINTFLVWIWDADSLNFYMQIVHFCFGLGAIIGPYFDSVGVLVSDYPASQLFWSYITLTLVIMTLFPWILFVPSPLPPPPSSSSASTSTSTTQTTDIELSAISSTFEEVIVVVVVLEEIADNSMSVV